MSPKDVSFDFFEGCVLRTDLLSNECRLVGQVNAVLVFGAFDNVVHCAKAVLDLLHQAAFSLQALPLIVLHLVEHVDQLLLQGVFCLSKIAVPVVHLFFHFTFNC